MKRLMMTSVLIAAVAVMAGCGKDRDVKKASAGPAEVLDQMTVALLDGNKDEFLSYYQASAAQKQALIGMFDFSQAGMAFRDKFIAAYGQDAWDTFQSDASQGASMSLPERYNPDEVTVDIDGDAAMVTATDEPQPLQLVRKNGVWLIDAESMVGPDGQAAKIGTLMSKMAEIIRDYTNVIGQPGMTPEQLDEEMGMAFLQAMMGG